MADHAIRPDRQRKTGIGMQGGVVLDLRALAEFDPLIIAAQYRTEPDTGVPFEPHLTDQGRSRRDPILAGLREFRTHCVEFVDHRFSALHLHPIVRQRIGNCRGSGKPCPATASAVNNKPVNVSARAGDPFVSV